MRFLILSDLHLEWDASFKVPKGVDYDAVVLAGDICVPGSQAVRWAAREEAFNGRPVVLVPGNHEYYGREMEAELVRMREAAVGTNVLVLSRDAVVLGDVRVLGATLWTDFALPVQQLWSPGDAVFDTDILRALRTANRVMLDFQLVEVLSRVKAMERGFRRKRLLSAEDTLVMHWVDRDWLTRQIKSEPQADESWRTTLVVTHHAPSSASVPPQDRTHWLSPACASELPTGLFGTKGVEAPNSPSFWVHGHVHASFDYRRGGCRVLSNARGSPTPEGRWENRDFESGYVIEV